MMTSQAVATASARNAPASVPVAARTPRERRATDTSPGGSPGGRPGTSGWTAWERSIAWSTLAARSDRRPAPSPQGLHQLPEVGHARGRPPRARPRPGGPGRGAKARTGGEAAIRRSSGRSVGGSCLASAEHRARALPPLLPLGPVVRVPDAGVRAGGWRREPPLPLQSPGGHRGVLRRRRAPPPLTRAGAGPRLARPVRGPLRAELGGGNRRAVRHARALPYESPIPSAAST